MAVFILVFRENSSFAVILRRFTRIFEILQFLAPYLLEFDHFPVFVLFIPLNLSHNLEFALILRFFELINQISDYLALNEVLVAVNLLKCVILT